MCRVWGDGTCWRGRCVFQLHNNRIVPFWYTRIKAWIKEASARLQKSIRFDNLGVSTAGNRESPGPTALYGRWASGNGLWGHDPRRYAAAAACGTVCARLVTQLRLLLRPSFVGGRRLVYVLV